ncbi:cyclomaltodextrinase [Artemisia annua]|uniref:Cyclomaltodextrinase n=1 Tax=Artemisia annua TaxID=35608 RepID=A0A2U1LNI9_ARTAN|nr:cyclomaltodextrinase [Artemisia annua]
MKNSDTPNDFPTKKQLLDAGRLDLVTAISNTGGWLAFGWDDDDQDPPHPHFDTTSSLYDDAEQDTGGGGGGVDGILTRLHNHRMRSHQEYKAHHVADKSTPREVSTTYFSDFQAAEIDYGKEDSHDKIQQLHEISPDHIRSRLQHMELELSSALHSLRSKSLTLNSEVSNCFLLSSSCDHFCELWDMRINCIMHRAQRFTHFHGRYQKSTTYFMALVVIKKANILVLILTIIEILDTKGGVILPKICVLGDGRYLFRMSLLFAWISASMCVGACSGMHTGRMHRFQFCATLVTKVFSSNLNQVHDSSASELQQLSDVWEFQENELMKAEDKLRSIRSKLAVFEGKIALSVTETQKLVEEKQRRIDSAHRTLKLLRTTCIFWTHSASEVLLVGSFDGWTSQIKMEKTSTGIFSSSLKLYPGRYEIKFIVDGIWRVDPMLPVVHINGYENNSLVVRE